VDTDPVTPVALKILIDLQSMHSESAGRGVGQYVLALAGALDRRRDVSLSVLLNQTHDRDGLLAARELVQTTAPHAVVHTVEAPWPWPDAVFDQAAHAVAVAVRREFVRELAPDVVMIDNVFEPPFSSVHDGDRAFHPIPTAAILYDLIPIEHVDHSFPSDDFARDYRGRLALLHEVGLLLSISARRGGTHHGHQRGPRPGGGARS
jgi:hypothetical protein